MVRYVAKILVFTALVATVGTVAAQDDEAPAPSAVESLKDMTPEERHKFLSDMTPEEREALKERVREARKKRREAYEALTPEEKEALKQQARERYEQMPEEEKAAIKERRKKMRDRRAQNATEASKE